jgi:hypothetical protein
MTPLTVALVQANPRSGDTERLRACLPQSAGLLEAYALRYASQPESLRFLPAPAWRVPIPLAVERLREADVVGFSAYVWNWNYSLALAQALKAVRPDRLIVFGGPHVPDQSEDFLRRHRFVDVAVHGEGERAFLAILERAFVREWDGIGSISYLGPDGAYSSHRRGDSVENLDELPSPFLTGVFDGLLRNHPNYCWEAIWQTGRAVGRRVLRFAPERLLAEADWMARNRIHQVFVTDGSFGTRPHDVQIVRMLDDALERHTRRMLVLVSYSGVPSSERRRIGSVSRCSLGAPGETYSRFTQSIADLMQQKPDRLAIEYCHVLPNTEASRPEYRSMHGLECVHLPVNPPKAPGTISGFPEERIEIIVGTRTMPRQDWLRARVFAWMTLFLDCGRMARIPLRTLAENYEVPYVEMIEAFMDAGAVEFPILARIAGEMIDSAERVQSGQHEFRHRADLLKIWWAPDVYPVAWLGAEGRLAVFFEECARLLAGVFPQVDRNLTRKAVARNWELLVKPSADIGQWLTFIAGNHPNARLSNESHSSLVVLQKQVKKRGGAQYA